MVDVTLYTILNVVGRVADERKTSKFNIYEEERERKGRDEEQIEE
jgi:hypothetical protein